MWNALNRAQAKLSMTRLQLHRQLVRLAAFAVMWLPLGGCGRMKVDRASARIICNSYAARKWNRRDTFSQRSHCAPMLQALWGFLWLLEGGVVFSAKLAGSVAPAMPAGPRNHRDLLSSPCHFRGPLPCRACDRHPPSPALTFNSAMNLRAVSPAVRLAGGALRLSRPVGVPLYRCGVRL